MEGNPLAFLGLKRVGVDSDESPRKAQDDNVELNRRGLPARKRKKNSLIFGGDEVVSIPVRSPKKKPTPLKSSPSKSSPKKVVIEREKEKKEVVMKQTEVRIPSSDIRRLAKLELDSLVNGNGNGAIQEEEEEDDLREDSDAPSELEDLEDPDEEDDDYPVELEAVPLAPLPTFPEKEEDTLSLLNRHNAQRLGVALRNLLKLPKAHKWVCFEFFYSNIDRVLFNGQNDFMVCLKESFPQLKTRRLSRVEWCKVRRLMGKPRRCSEAFFAEERAELERKRQRIRTLQQRKVIDAHTMKDLPEEIPMQLTIGTKVTARLRSPQDGLFTGRVDAVDPSNSTFRITFDRLGLGTHSIPDHEVLSVEPPDLIPLTSYLNKPRMKPFPTSSSYPSPVQPKYGSVHSPLTNDPLLSGSTPRNKMLRKDHILGGYPVSFLHNIVKLNKSLKGKREKVSSLRELNTEAEKRKSFGALISEDFQKKYAGTVLDIRRINEDLNSFLRDIDQYTTHLGNQQGPSLSLPDRIRENCQEEGYELVNRYNTGQTVQSPKMLALITQLSALMLQVKRVADGERNAAELEALKDSMEKIKSSLKEPSVKVFQNSVEVEMQHIQQGLSQVGNLNAFMHADPGKQQQPPDGKPATAGQQ